MTLPKELENSVFQGTPEEYQRAVERYHDYLIRRKEKENREKLNKIRRNRLKKQGLVPQKIDFYEEDE